MEHRSLLDQAAALPLAERIKLVEALWKSIEQSVLLGDAPTADAAEPRDWREHFAGKLQGRGLEIGPLHRPMIRHDGMQIDYIDRCTTQELREHYPELAELPLVEPTILGDAETLRNVRSETYDFVVAAHVIEHMRNPLRALEQWCRVVKPRGLIYLVVPDKRVTFDQHRPRTTLPHVILDYHEPSAARDFEHYLDFATHVDEKAGEDAIGVARWRERIDYSIHFHVWTPADVVELLTWFSDHLWQVDILEGPVSTPGSDEFHLLLKVGSRRLRRRPPFKERVRRWLRRLRR